MPKLHIKTENPTGPGRWYQDYPSLHGLPNQKRNVWVLGHNTGMSVPISVSFIPRSQVIPWLEQMAVEYYQTLKVVPHLAYIYVCGNDTGLVVTRGEFAEWSDHFLDWDLPVLPTRMSLLLGAE